MSGVQMIVQVDGDFVREDGSFSVDVVIREDDLLAIDDDLYVYKKLDVDDVTGVKDIFVASCGCHDTSILCCLRIFFFVTGHFIIMFLKSFNKIPFNYIY